MKDTSEAYRDLCASAFPGPHWLLVWFVGWPLVLCVKTLTMAPWAALMYPALNSPFTKPTIEPVVLMILVWFTQFNRLALRFMARVGSVLLAPIAHILIMVFIKKVIFGRITKPGARDTSQWTLFRLWFMQQLLPGQDLGGITRIIGTHYEPGRHTVIIFRNHSIYC